MYLRSGNPDHHGDRKTGGPPWAVWDGLRRLSADMREILILQHFREYQYEEIAEAMDIPMGTAASQHYRARKALQRESTDIYPITL